MHSGSATATPTPVAPYVLSVGPSWLALAACAGVAGAMAPWLLAKDPVELPIPWMGVWTLPEGMPLWVAAFALVFAFVFSLRSRVIVDPKTRTITRWRCVGVLIPWSVATRSFDEVRFVRMVVSSGFLASILNVLQSMPGEHGEPANPSPVKLGGFLVQVVFQDRDWFNVAKGKSRHMVALSEELCRVMETRRG